MDKDAGGNNDPTPEIIMAIVVLALIAGIFTVIGPRVLPAYIQFIDHIYGWRWRGIELVLQIAFALIDIACIVVIFIISRRYLRLQTEEGGNSEIAPPIHIESPQDEFARNWQGIYQLLESENPSDWNMAVLRADAQLDDALMHRGIEGETMADRLKIVSPSALPSLDRVWSAHRLRNSIAHDPLEQHTKEMITHALQSYELAFQELGYIKK